MQEVVGTTFYLPLVELWHYTNAFLLQSTGSLKMIHIVQRPWMKSHYLFHCSLGTTLICPTPLDRLTQVQAAEFMACGWPLTGIMLRTLDSYAPRELVSRNVVCSKLSRFEVQACFDLQWNTHCVLQRLLWHSAPKLIEHTSPTFLSQMGFNRNTQRTEPPSLGAFGFTSTHTDQGIHQLMLCSCLSVTFQAQEIGNLISILLKNLQLQIGLEDLHIPLHTDWEILWKRLIHKFMGICRFYSRHAPSWTEVGPESAVGRGRLLNVNFSPSSVAANSKKFYNVWTHVMSSYKSLPCLT